MTSKHTLPQLTGQWIDLVELKGPVQLPSRPKQMIDSYSTIWQKGARLWAGDGFGSVTAAGVVTMYDQQAQYTNGEIIWPGEQGLNAYVRTVDLAGAWIDEACEIHDLAQKTSPVELTQAEQVLGRDLIGSITGYTLSFTILNSDVVMIGTLSKDCFTISWEDGSTWQRHLHLEGDWISIKSKCRQVIHCQKQEVMISGIPGVIDLSNWYVKATEAPFPDNKVKGGIDLDSTAIHWSDYIGWQRFFDLTGAWLDQSGVVHGIANQRLQDPTEYRRFTWLFNASCNSTGSLIRNWIELTNNGETICGRLNFDCNHIHWENGDVWKKQ